MLMTVRANCVHAEQAGAWCTVNSPDAANLTHSHSVEVGSVNTQVVAAEYQAASKQRLAASAAIEIDRSEATKLGGGQLTAQPEKVRYYLIRAAAVTMDANYHLWSQIEVSVYPEQKTALVFNGGLARGHVEPRNLALIIATDYEIRQVIGVCSTAE